MNIGVHAAAGAPYILEPTGVEYYTKQLLRFFPNIPGALAHRFFLYVNRPVFLKEKFPDFYKVKVLRSPFMWTQIRLSLEMLLRPPDTLFTPSQALPRIIPKRVISTIHGLEFKRYPNLYSFGQRRRLSAVTKDAVERSSRLIAVSGATKKDLIHFYGADAKKITVVHHGAPSLPTSINLSIADAKPPYFLYVGRLELKKNVDGIIRAFNMFCSRRGENYELVLAGSPGFGFAKIKEEIWRSKYASSIRTLGYVSEDKKWALLKKSAAFIFPSWAEGFGLPILEAQAANVPVITGNITSMPEVAGDGALFVSPGDSEELAGAMHKVIEEEALRQSLIARGAKNIERFSWESAADKTLRVILGLQEAQT